MHNSKKGLGLTLAFILIPLIGFFYTYTNQPTLPAPTLIIDKLSAQSDLSLSLYYSDLAMQDIREYHLTPTANPPLTSSAHPWIPYTEGFITADTYSTIMEALTLQDIATSTVFHDWSLTDKYTFVAFSGGLESIFAVDSVSQQVLPLNFNVEDNLGSMYVSYMQQVDDTLVIVGGEFNAYNLLIYTVDLPTLTVSSKRRIPTASTIIDDTDFTLLKDGTCLWSSDQTIVSYNPITLDETQYSLPFVPDGVVPYQSDASNDSFLTYQIMDSTMQFYSPALLSSQSITLPSSNPKVIDLYTKDDLLILVLFDPMGIKFQNYISIYDLHTQEWAYLMGLESLDPLALIDSTL